MYTTNLAKIWWQIYKAVIVSKKYTEDYFRNLPIEDFKKLFLREVNWPIALHIIGAEYYWIKANKPNYFIEQGVVDFLLNTKSEHTIKDIKFDAPIAISWHPSDKLPACLVYPTQPAVIIHVNDDKYQGTWTTIIPYEATASEPVDVMIINKTGDPGLNESPIHAKKLEQLVFGLLTYMQAFPHLIRSGVPNSMKNRNLRFFGTAKGFSIALHPKIKASPTAHYRSGCWRCLGHERFKRNPDGSVRVIYVNSCIVGDLTPYTVEEYTGNETSVDK